jgi:hypothetical protein
MRIPVNFALYWKAFFVERSLALVVNNLFGGFICCNYHTGDQ